jgi:hypothetical protein
MGMIFGPKRDEVTVDWRRIHHKELDTCSSPNIIRVIKSIRKRWADNVACMWNGEGCAYRGLVGKSEGKRPL